MSLRRLMESGELPDVPIHIDSPMVVDATLLCAKYAHDPSLDGDLATGGRPRLFPRNVCFHRGIQESKALKRLPRPRIIVSASGMLAGGRARYHVPALGQSFQLD